MAVGLVRAVSVSVGDIGRRGMVAGQAAGGAIVRSEEAIGDAEVSLVPCKKKHGSSKLILYHLKTMLLSYIAS